MLTASVRSPLATHAGPRARRLFSLRVHASGEAPPPFQPRGVVQSAPPSPPSDVPGTGRGEPRGAVLLVRRSGEPLVGYKSLDVSRGVAHTRVGEIAEQWGLALQPAALPAYVALRVVRRGGSDGQPVEFLDAAADATQPTEAEEAAAAATAPLDLRLTLSAAGVTPGTFLAGCVRGVDVPVTELKHSLACGKQTRTAAVWKMYAQEQLDRRLRGGARLCAVHAGGTRVTVFDFDEMVAAASDPAVNLVWCANSGMEIAFHVEK